MAVVRKRRRNMSLQYSVIAFIVLLIFALLSVTVLFNIKTAVVEGSSIYTPEEIITAGGINGGDNMIRKNMGKAEQTITSELIYIETAEIKRKLPSSVEIIVTPCTETASLESEDGFMIVSSMGKILRFSEEPAEGTRIFYGTEPAEGMSPGMIFSSADDEKTKVIFRLMELSEESTFGEQITSYDVRDRLNISCVYDNRIEVDIGVITDADYKFKLANKIISTSTAPDFEGKLKIFGKAGQLLSNDDLQQIEDTYEYNITSVTVTEPAESETEPDGESSGNDESGEGTESTESSAKLNFE